MKEMLACLCDGMFKSRSDRIAFAALALLMLMMGTALRLNDLWAEQRQSDSPGIIWFPYCGDVIPQADGSL